MSLLPPLTLLLSLLFTGTATAEEPVGTPENVDVKSLVDEDGVVHGHRAGSDGFERATGGRTGVDFATALYGLTV